MTDKATEILKEALLLQPSEREALASHLYDSLLEDYPETHASWEKEIERRLAELDQGSVEPISWAEAQKIMFGK